MLAQADTGASAGKTGTPADAGKKDVSKGDKNYMNEMAYANISEVATGQLAVEKTKNPEVKNFAQKMIDDHSKALDEMKAMAQQKGVTLPTEPDPQHKSAAKKLSGLSGDAFDKMYMHEAGTVDHRNTIRLLQKVSKNADDPELKAAAGKMLPIVEHHLEMANAITGNKGKSPPRDMQKTAPAVRQ
ncbi:MAG: DUF4142 domain-containing protein [Burkholderiaceae bacterium]